MLAEHEQLTDKLIELLREHAFARGQLLEQRAEMFHRLSGAGHNITMIREAVAHNTATGESELIQLQGEIDATRARLHHIELRMRGET